MPNYGDLKTNKTPQETRADIEDVFNKWGVSDWNAPFDRKTYQRVATVRFVINGEEKRLSCDRFSEYHVNLRAIYLALAELRLASQRGILEQFRQFFKELPAAGESTAIADPYKVMGVTPETPVEVVDAAFRALAKSAHPDTGGSEEQFKRLQRAYDMIKEQRR